MSARAGPRRANLPALAVRQQRRPLRRVGRGRGSWRGRLAGDERYRRHARVGLGQPQVLTDGRVAAGVVLFTSWYSSCSAFWEAPVRRPFRCSREVVLAHFPWSLHAE